MRKKQKTVDAQKVSDLGSSDSGSRKVGAIATLLNEIARLQLYQPTEDRDGYQAAMLKHLITKAWTACQGDPQA